MLHQTVIYNAAGDLTTHSILKGKKNITHTHETKLKPSRSKKGGNMVAMLNITNLYLRYSEKRCINIAFTIYMEETILLLSCT